MIGYYKQFGGMEINRVIVLILILSLIQHIQPVDSTYFVKESIFDPFVNDENSTSFSGNVLTEGSSSIRILGKEVNGPGGRLGSFFWIGDLDQDGVDDLAVNAPNSYGSEGSTNGGDLYIFYGDQERYLDSSYEVDLMYRDPDVVIRGARDDSKLSSDITVGDLDGDGNVDLILGISLQPMCGRVYILWGEETPLPPIIDLYDPGTLSPNGDPYGIMRTSSQMIIAGHLAPVPWPESDYLTGQSVMVKDLDGDANDDLIFSSPGWNHIVILWGQGDRNTLGNEMTIIQDDLVSRLGDTMDIGDIDGDGTFDIAVGAPIRTNEELYDVQTGAVLTFFNIGRLRGNETVDADYVARPIIWGRDPFDHVGEGLLIEDLNGDGKDDLIIGSPDSDGLNEKRQRSGDIFLIWGDDIETFPTNMIGDIDSDIHIRGAIGDDDDISGNRIGSIFEVADIDNDGRKDLILGIPKHIEKNGIETGAVIIFSGKDIFFSGKTNIDLLTIDPLVRFIGNDPYDQMGYAIGIGDIDGNGIIDLAMGSPSADGFFNQRPGCGEAFIFIGSKAVLGDMRISGDLSDDTRIFCDSGTISLNFSFGHINGPSSIRSAYLIIDPEGEDLVIKYDGNDFLASENTLKHISIIDQGSPFKTNGIKGFLELNIEIGWYIPFDHLDVYIAISDDEGKWTNRLFRDRADVYRDINLEGDLKISVNGDEMHTDNDWVKPGDQIDFYGPGLVYTRAEEVKVKSENAWVDLFYNGTMVQNTPALRWELGVNIGGDIDPVYSIKPSISTIPPDGTSSDHIPKFGSSIEFSPLIDDSPPDGPSDVTLFPDGMVSGQHDDDDIWNVSWQGGIGSYWDSSGSGVKEYIITVEDGEGFSVKEGGGLWGSYYMNRYFTSCGFNGTDQVIDFSEDEWGKLGPNEICVPDFSVRWHGWIDFPRTDNYDFLLSGTGNAKVVLGGDILFDWSDLTANPRSTPTFYSEGEVVPVVIYFRQNGETSSFSFKWQDENGYMVPVPGEYLYHPVNRTTVHTPSTGVFNISVRSVDWVGYYSDEEIKTGIIDDIPPEFDLEDLRAWYPEADPNVSFKVIDPAVSSYMGSGISSDDIFFRLKPKYSAEYTIWSNEGVSIVSMDIYDDISIVCEVSIILPIKENWRGLLEILAYDKVGNKAKTSPISIGTDTSPPTFEILSPNIDNALSTNAFDMTLKVMDRFGSGVDMGSVRYRFRTNSSEWSEWDSMDGEGVMEEGLIVKKMNLPYGFVEIQFNASDSVGNIALSEPFVLDIEIPLDNKPPIPKISYPVNNSRFSEGVPITLNGNGTLDDGLGGYLELEYTWFSSIQGYIGSGKIMRNTYLDVGNHSIRLFVNDGELNISTSIIIMIFPLDMDNDGGNRTDPDEEGADLVYIIIILLVMAIVLGVISFMLYKRFSENEEETSTIDFRELTYDDILYDEMIEKEERELGLHLAGKDDPKNN